MTDKEIIKALECCISPECDNCPYDGDDLLRPCNHNLMKDALDLINRQQATIETLRKCVERHHIIRKDGKSPLSLLTAEIKAEAIKEFAEKIADVFCSHDKGDTYVREVVCNLVKEMVGEDK